MYRKDNGQISIMEFMSPFGKLNPENRWVKKAALVPWNEIEEKYDAPFCENNGTSAKPLRMALGALIIQREMKSSDEETLQLILESPYLQFFIGLHEFTNDAPFAATMMVYFRKRISVEMLQEINTMMFEKKIKMMTLIHLRIRTIKTEAHLYWTRLVHRKTSHIQRMSTCLTKQERSWRA